MVPVILALVLREPAQPPPPVTPSATIQTTQAEEPSPSAEPTPTEPAVETPPPNSQSEFCQNLVAMRPELEAAAEEMQNVQNAANLTQVKAPVDKLIELLSRIQEANAPENLHAALEEALTYVRRMSVALTPPFDYVELEALKEEGSPVDTMNYWQEEAEVYCMS
jgi:hypothetical protein